MTSPPRTTPPASLAAMTTIKAFEMRLVPSKGPVDGQQWCPPLPCKRIGRDEGCLTGLGCVDVDGDPIDARVPAYIEFLDSPEWTFVVVLVIGC